VGEIEGKPHPGPCLTAGRLPLGEGGRISMGARALLFLTP